MNSTGVAASYPTRFTMASVEAGVRLSKLALLVNALLASG
jgi:hypothetical protein